MIFRGSQRFSEVLRGSQRFSGMGSLVNFRTEGPDPLQPTHKQLSRITSERILVTTVVLLMSYYDDSM